MAFAFRPPLAPPSYVVSLDLASLGPLVGGITQHLIQRDWLTSRSMNVLTVYLCSCRIPLLGEVGQHPTAGLTHSFIQGHLHILMALNYSAMSLGVRYLPESL